MVKYLLPLLFFISSQALACGVMEKADPKVGSTVHEASQVTLFFSEAFDPKESNAAITNASGNAMPANPQVLDSKTLKLALAQPLPPGRYKVSWNALWLDCGQKTQGDFKFTVQ